MPGKELSNGQIISELDIKRLLEVSPDAIVVHCDGAVVLANEAGACLLGVDNPEYLTGRPLREFIRQECLNILGNQVRMINQGQKTPIAEEKLIRADGKVLEVEVSSSLFCLRGKPMVTAQLRDIGSRKRLERELQQRMEFEKLITQISADFSKPIPGGDSKAFDTALCQIAAFAGAERTSLILFSNQKDQTSIFAEWCSEGLPSPNKCGASSELLPQWRESILQQKSVSVPAVDELPPLEQAFCHARGLKALLITPIVDGNSVLGFLEVGTARENREWSEQLAGRLKIVGRIFAHALERARVEEALRLSKQCFTKAFNAGASPMIIFDLAKKCFLTANDSFLRTTGFSREEIIGQEYSQLKLFPKRSQIDGLVQVFYRDGRLSNWEFDYQTKSGEERVARVSAETISLDGNPCILAVFDDLTERKQMEKEMGRLERLNLVGEMAASIGHEIRNPLTSVRGFLQVLGAKTEFSNYQEYFDLMIGELDRANSIITEFLSLAKNRPITFRVQSLNQIVNAIFPLILADAMNTNNYVTLELKPTPELLLNEKEVRQLILNLIRNGLEAMPEGGHLTVRTFEEGEAEVVLAVQDQGPGIPKDILEKVGTPFFTTKEDGTGLGLAVCYSIAARHNARMEIDTGPAGTTVSAHFKI